jgi:hypothetical protein
MAVVKTATNGIRCSQYCHLNLIFSVVRNLTYRYKQGPYVNGINTNSYNGRTVSLTRAKIISIAIKKSHVASIRSAIVGLRLVPIISPAKKDWVIPMYKISCKKKNSYKLQQESREHSERDLARYRLFQL